MSLFASLSMKPNLFNYDIKHDVFSLIERSGVDIETLRGKRVLVTGGTGFFGVWLLSALSSIKRSLGGELEIVVITRSSAAFLSKARRIALDDEIELIQGDVREIKFAGGGVTHLVHMATTNASETFAGEDQLNKLKVLYEGTKNVLEQCSNKLENVLFTSSGVAYGASGSEKITEVEPAALDTTDLSSSLAIGKIAAEYLVSFYAAKLDYRFTIARCFTFAGQHLPTNLHYAFGNFVNNALCGDDIIIKGDGLDMRSYLYIGDAVSWLLRMLVEPKNQLLNVGSEHSLSVGELADLIAKHTGVGVQILGKRSEIGNFKRANYIPNTTKARSLYHELNEWTDIDAIIKKMLCVK